MKPLFIHHPLFRVIAPPLTGILVYLLLLLVNNHVNDLANLFSNDELYVCMALSVLLMESMRLVIVLMDRRQRDTMPGYLIQSAIASMVGVATILIAISLYFDQIVGFPIGQGELMQFATVFFLVAILYHTLCIGNRYIRRDNTERIAQEEKLRETIEQAFRSFRQEINPDLLYDSLEELIIVMHNRIEDAEELIDSLASLYRYQLLNRHAEFVGIDAELKATKSLLHLLNRRHRNNIRFVNQLPAQADWLVMPGAMLSAIDSVVRNTLISAEAPLVLTLSTEDHDYMVLHHALNDRLQLHQESRETFLRLQRSYAHFADQPFIQVKAGRDNYIKFPLIQQAATL